MHFDYDVTFSLFEWIALTGLAQCLFILVYVFFRVRDLRQGSIAIAYFLSLACAFGLRFALRLEDYEAPIRLALWFSGAIGVPLCYLLVLQVSRLHAFRGGRHLLWLLSVPATLVVAVAMVRLQAPSCGLSFFALCPKFFEGLYWLWSMVGALCMLALFVQRDVFRRLGSDRGAKERYWLVITLIAANVLRIIVNLLLSTGNITLHDADGLQSVLGIAFAYLVTTTLFRVYPLPVALHTGARAVHLSEEEKLIADKVRNLMELEKLYQEPTFSRADLAREVGTSENTLSRVINSAFGKSFPRLLNEFRVEDAKGMLRDPAIPIQVLAFEAGFNSLASFNRVFREVTGETPSHYRARAALPGHAKAGDTLQ
jgi:AraC-like DNA-binding protein